MRNSIPDHWPYGELDPLQALRVAEGKRIAFRIAQERQEALLAESLRWFAERLRAEEVAQ